MKKFDPESYTIIVRKEEIDGDVLYVGRVAELPNITSFEDSFEAARNIVIDGIASLKKIADEKQIEFPLPNPAPESEYNGRVTLRLPRSLHSKVVTMAAQEDVSLNTYLVSAISSYVGESNGIAKFASNAASMIREVVQSAVSEAWTTDAIYPSPPRMYFGGGKLITSDEKTIPMYMYTLPAALSGASHG